MANNASQLPNVLQAKTNQSSQHTYEIRKYYLSNVLLVRSHMPNSTEQYSFILVTPSNCTEKNLRGNHNCLHTCIICYFICIVLLSLHKLKVGFLQDLKEGGRPWLWLWLVGSQQQPAYTLHGVWIPYGQPTDCLFGNHTSHLAET